MVGWTDGWMEGQMAGWLDGWMEDGWERKREEVLRESVKKDERAST